MCCLSLSEFENVALQVLHCLSEPDPKVGEPKAAELELLLWEVLVASKDADAGGKSSSNAGIGWESVAVVEPKRFGVSLLQGEYEESSMFRRSRGSGN